MIKKQWLKDDEEFFEQWFAYLKEKFSMEVPDLFHMQKNTGQAIYNETIVALENLHKVLRKIENGSFYKRADYEKAKQINDASKIQEITDFYQGLFFLRNEKLKFAFSRFNEFYDWDSSVTQFFRFIKIIEDNDNFEELWATNVKSEKQINLDKVFAFVNEYLNFVQKAESFSQEIKKSEKNPLGISNTEIKETSDSLKISVNEFVLDQINYQNKIYRLLNESFGRLQSQKIGICVFDIILPSRLKSEEFNSNHMSTSFLRRFLDSLEFVFCKDDGVLMRVNHTHIISENKVILSFLLIYKTKNYKNPQAVFDYYKKQVYLGLGEVLSFDVKVINREELIRKVYPKENFVGELRTEKQKIAFQEKFLRYFYSSIFILQADKVEDFLGRTSIENRYLNDFKFYEQKIYNSVKPNKKVKSGSIVAFTGEIKKEYLDDLLTDEIVEKAANYFPLADISVEGSHRLKIITYLYKQHFSLKTAAEEIEDQIQSEKIVEGLVRTGKSIEELVSKEEHIENLIQAEKFITWLMYNDWYHGFKSKQAEKNFDVRPTFSKLSLPVRQMLLISKMIKDLDNIRFPIYLKTPAITLLKKFDGIFFRNTKLNQLDIVESDLKKYKKDYLHPVMKKEKLFFKRAVLAETRVKEYLKQIFEKNLILVRLVFDCGQFDDEKDSAKIFDAMFREYIENLKRRHTAKLKLLGHVATYVPNKKCHYIDATLFFEFDTNEDVDPVALIDELVQFWENYVQNKATKISERNKRIGTPYTGNQINPFDIFRDKKLTATSVNIIKTEIELNHEYIEFYKGRKKTQNKLIEKISIFYAYCPLILVDEKDLEYLPRKDCLILGRIRKKNDDGGKDKNSEEKQSSSGSSVDPKSTQVETNLPPNESGGTDQPETTLHVQNIENSNNSDVIDQVALDKPTASSKNRVDPPKPVVKIRRGERKQRRGKLIVKEHEDL